MMEQTKWKAVKNGMEGIDENHLRETFDGALWRNMMEKLIWRELQNFKPNRGAHKIICSNKLVVGEWC